MSGIYNSLSDNEIWQLVYGVDCPENIIPLINDLKIYLRRFKMLPSIKQYHLKPNITKEDLLRAGFKNGGWQSKFKEPKVSYGIELINDEINLFIEIETDTMIFDCYDNVLILDEDFGQPYGAFYGDSEFDYLNKVIDKYNMVMDRFVEKGIFE